MNVRHEVVIHISRYPARTETITAAELAERCSCCEELVRRLAGHGLVEPVGGGAEEPLFELSAVPRLSRALRLKRDLGLNVDALALVMDLLDRIEELERG